MSLCNKCNKPVYFAERRYSLGKDWHRSCLACAECGKVLHPGQHAQHKGTPYCDVPCYSALFGPTMFGHGSPIEAHNNFGMLASKVSSPVKKPDLQTKLRAYNEYYDSKNLQVKSKEVNGRLVLEGPLRIHWGVRSTIQLAERDESTASRETWRRSYTLAMCNGLDEEFLQKMDNGGATLKEKRSSLSDRAKQPVSEPNLTQNPDDSLPLDDSLIDSPPKSPFNTVVIRSDPNKKRRRQRSKRLSIINGHIFNVDTSVFTPAHGSITSVTVTSLDTVPDVVKQLLEKYKVQNKPSNFSLCAVRISGETHVLKEEDCPLIQRVMLGPLEDEARIFIVDKGKVRDVDEEVAHFVNLPDAVLEGFLGKLDEEEEQELEQIRHRYKRYKTLLEGRIADFNSTYL